jgi:signal transduction histidine kinase
MIVPKKHTQEKRRLAELQSYNILDTLPESDYDGLTKIAAQICGVPIALISLVDEDRQWFKSTFGIEVSETPRDLAFCAHTINDEDNELIVEDARKDERFHDNPLVIDDPNVIFYGGIPIKSENGLPLGTLCVIDNKPNSLNDSQKESLKALSKQVMNLLILRKRNRELNEVVEKLEDKNSDLEQFAYVASHDIKSPLLNISNLAGMFLADYRSDINQDGANLIDLILKTSEQLYLFLERLMEYSTKIDNLEETKERVKFEIFKENTLDFYASEKNIELTINSKLKHLKINVFIVGQILTNLINNAIKYNDKPVALVNLDISETESLYRFTVSDNGPGIKEEYLDKIFKIFVKLAKKDKYGNEGSGIGLAIVKKLVTKLGGSIQVSSKLEKGSKFTFTISK